MGEARTDDRPIEGIVLGLAILGLFAVFEKRRHDVLRILEDIRTWD